MTRTLYDVRQVDEALAELVQQGALRSEQAEAVHARLTTAHAVEPPLARGIGVGTLAAAYVGVGLVLAAIATLIGQNWQDMTVLARTAVFLTITLVLIGAGAVLQGRFDAARGLAWLAAVLSSGGLGAALFSADSVEGSSTFLAGAVVAVLASIPLLALHREPPQVVGFVGALFICALSVAGRFELGPITGGSSLWVLGMLLSAGAVTGLLPVRGLTMALAGFMALVGAQFVGAESLLLCTVLALVLAFAGYVLAVREDAAVPLTIATLTVATTGPRVLGQWLHGSIGASGVLALSGLIVLAAAATHVSLVRRREEKPAVHVG